LTISAQLGIDKRERSTEAQMPGNPEECRRHALECVRLAQTTAVPQRREYFAKLARTWIALAEELERSRELLDEELDEPGKRTG
jgi:hypothetical protein